MTTNFHPDWLKAPYPDSILMPNSYRVEVTQITPELTRSATEITPPMPTQITVFSQTFAETDFDMQSFVLAINKKKRVRKARAGKEAQS